MNKILSRALINYVFLSALRDKIIVSIFLIIALSLSLSVFLGSSAFIEKDQFVAVYAAGAIRIATIIGLVLFIIFYIRRSFESRDVDYLLSRPISRICFILSHAVAFMMIAAIVGLVCVIAVYPFVSQLGGSYGLWALSLIVEFMIMACAAMFFSMVISSAAAGAIITLAFYTLSRLIGQLVNIVTSHKVGSMESDEGFRIIGEIMLAISLFIPRLDLMAQTSWLIYGEQGAIGYYYVLIHGAVFCAILMTATIIDLQKREF